MLTIDCTPFHFIRSAEFDPQTQSLTVTLVCAPDDVTRMGGYVGNRNVDDELLDVVNLIPTVMRTKAVSENSR